MTELYVPECPVEKGMVTGDKFRHWDVHKTIEKNYSALSRVENNVDTHCKCSVTFNLGDPDNLKEYAYGYLERGYVEQSIGKGCKCILRGTCEPHLEWIKKVLGATDYSSMFNSADSEFPTCDSC